MLKTDERGFAHLFFLFLLALVILGVIGYSVYSRLAKDDYSSGPAIQSNVTNASDIKPELTYQGAYNGKLYLTGEKVGESAPWAVWAKNLDRNGVATVIAYFGIENAGDGKQIAKILKDFPGRLVPFYSTGVGGEEEGEMAQSGKLIGAYKKGYESAQSAGQPFMRGIGEVETQDWLMPHDDPKVLELFQFAAEHKMNVMFHVKPGQTQAVSAIAKRLPDNTFLIHMFPNDFDREKNNIISLLKENQNLAYTIDADHLMFDHYGPEPIGLLYKYQDELDNDIDPSKESVEQAAGKFNTDFDQLEPKLRMDALERFGDLVRAAPDQVTIGTELNVRYGYEPASFDRIIKHLRFFIAGFDQQTQAKLAHDNAQRLFGDGLRIQ